LCAPSPTILRVSASGCRAAQRRWRASIARSPVAEPVALLALTLDAAIGWPDRLYERMGHPVGGIARIIGRGERIGNRADRSDVARRLAGAATVLLATGAAAGIAWLLQQALAPLGWWTAALLAWPGLAQRSLDDHVRPVAAALEAGELAAARGAVARIVGRDTAALDETGVVRAAIESLAESFADGIAAPLLWLLVAGPPGLWAYKSINTADSLIGHREPRWRAFGWAAARTDDIANLIPARLSGVAICCVGGGWRTMWRDCRRHASPNAGWPEAAMAGALGVRLAGPVSYDGAIQAKDWIGSGRDPVADDLRRGLRVYRGACALLWIVAGGIAWWR
jgi:adenosylcobinamide-phosphate synthase